MLLRKSSITRKSLLHLHLHHIRNIKKIKWNKWWDILAANLSSDSSRRLTALRSSYTNFNALYSLEHSARRLGSKLSDNVVSKGKTTYTRSSINVNTLTVRPRDTRPQAARTLTMHVFELGPTNFEIHVFDEFYLRCTNFWLFSKKIFEMHVFS